MDGPLLRGRCIDEIVAQQPGADAAAASPGKAAAAAGAPATAAEVRGLPPVPESVAAFGGGRIFVAARVRPQTALELSEGGMYAVELGTGSPTEAEDASGQDDGRIRVMGEPGMHRDTDFQLHRVLGPDASQRETYETTAHPVIEGVLYGYNGE